MTLSRFMYGKLTFVGCFIAMFGALLILCPLYVNSGIAISIIGLSISQLGTYRRTRRFKKPSVIGG